MISSDFGPDASLMIGDNNSVLLTASFPSGWLVLFSLLSESKSLR